MTRIVIEPFSGAHVDEAARLVADRYRLLRRALPVLPPEHENRAGIAVKLEPMAAAGPGFAATADGRLSGFIAGIRIPSFKGPGAGRYVPEWAHAAGGGDRGTVLRRLYQAAAAAWVADGCYSHAITSYAGDDEERDVFYRFGFGLCVVDAVRGTDRVEGAFDGEAPDGIAIRRAGPEDANPLAG